MLLAHLALTTDLALNLLVAQGHRGVHPCPCPLEALEAQEGPVDPEARVVQLVLDLPVRSENKQVSSFINATLLDVLKAEQSQDNEDREVK